ncbi:MAG: YggT family protein [bacterium]|nr:YggT family protein [bacterium]
MVNRVTDDLALRSRKYAVVYYVLNVIEALLLIRFILKLLGANNASGFTSGIYAITEPFVLPFRGIFPTPTASGSVLEWSTIIAMIIYALIAYGVVQLLRIAYAKKHIS